MKAKSNSTPKKRVEPPKVNPPQPPLAIRDPVPYLSEISQTEIVEFATAVHVFRIARADFEAKRAALLLKLLQCQNCEEGDYFALLGEHDDLIIEDRTSLEAGTRRPILDRRSVSSGGAV
jgi:hypothetical protein